MLHLSFWVYGPFTFISKIEYNLISQKLATFKNLEFRSIDDSFTFLVYCIHDSGSYKNEISTFLKTILALYLKVEDLFFIQFAKGDASWHQHRCCFWHSEHFPSQIFKKGCQFGLEIQFSWNEIESGILSFLIEKWKTL